MPALAEPFGGLAGQDCLFFIEAHELHSTSIDEQVQLPQC